nr:hypothetical protein [Tanacetum cinerariifolium]
MQDNAKKSCMTSFQILHSFLQVLSYDESKSKRVSERAFMTLFGQDNETFTSTMFLYVDQLQNQLDKAEFQEDKSMAAFWALNNQFQKFIDCQYFLDYDSEMTEKLFAKYTRIKVKQFKETLLLHMGNVKKSVAERTRHKRQYDRRMKERQMQSRESKVVSSKALDAILVVTECSGTKSGEHITSSSSGTYITHVVDAYIRLVNDQVPFIEVDSNTTPDSTNMSHRGGEIDQDAKQDQVKSPLLKAQIQEKVFANAALKNELRKFSETSVDTKFAKPSILRKPVLQPHRNQSVVRQPNAFKSEQRNFSKPRNSQEESYGSNDMAHNHYLEEARKKTQERNKNSKPSVIPSIRLQNTANGHRFSPKKSSVVYEKTSLRSCLRWKHTGKIFTTVGLKWIPTGKLFDSCKSKVDSEPPNGSNDDITNPYECDQTLNVSAGAKEQIHGHQNAQFDNAPLLHNLSSDMSSEESTLQGFIPSNLHHLNQSFDTFTKLTKNHPLDNVIGDPS